MEEGAFLVSVAPEAQRSQLLQMTHGKEETSCPRGCALHAHEEGWMLYCSALLARLMPGAKEDTAISARISESLTKKISIPETHPYA